MTANSPVLSIVTPTYNRGHLLRNCYASLLAQTQKNFEWIIVDDGSTDDTEAIAKEFNSDSFPVIYIKKENGGKHTALNIAMEYIHGQYVLILDSDDTLTGNAVATVLNHWNRHKDTPEVGIVTFLKGHGDSNPVCTVSDYDVPVDILRYKRTALSGSDCCEVIRAELFRKYPFPVFEGERFIAECALWNRVAKTHKCVYINEVIYICEYLEDGLTKAGKAMRIRNPHGGMFTSNLRMGKNNYLSQRIKYSLLYACYGFFAGLTTPEILKKHPGNLWFKILCMLPGYLIHRNWKHKYMK